MIKSKFSLAILICTSTLAFSQVDLKDRIENIVKTKKAKVGVAVWHLEKGDSISINGEKHLPMQSVFKFPIAMSAMDLVDQGKLNLNQKVFVKKEDLKTNTWSPLREKYPNGEVNIPLSEIISYSVAQSDNNGVDILLKLMGGVDVVQNYIQNIGVHDFQIVSNEEEMHRTLEIQYQNYISAKGSNLLLKKLYTEPVLKKASRDFLIQVLESTNTGPNRLEGLLPANTVVAHKTGTSYTEDGFTPATNDVGVITLPNKEHLIVSVLVSDSYENEKANEAIIAEIAKASFDYYTK